MKAGSTVEQESNPVGWQEFAQQFLQNFHDSSIVDRKSRVAAKEAGEQAKEDAKDELAAAKGESVESAEVADVK